ncbi:MAG: amidohydrolase [Taibaiella sp.]|nr:amidohydrolase [Taibaiella sp.]
MTPQLHITLIQPDIVWENKGANLEHYSSLMDTIKGPRHLVVLPEMFSTGFSMSPERLAESMDGPSVNWMKEMAQKHRCILAGSLMIGEDDKYYNRLLWVQPDGQVIHYDKRHLFGHASEDKHYSPGETRVITQVNGWRINLMVCYDLRFPVWARNREAEYDVLLYVANWPEARSLAWRTLLQARAIENQSYVVGVNRVGADPKGNNYSGDSSVIGPLGEIIWHSQNEVAVHTVTLEKTRVDETRTKLPFLKDADKFMLL